MWLTLIDREMWWMKEQQPADADQRQQHRAEDRHHWCERMRHRARGGQRCHAVGEGAEEDAERPLCAAVAHEANQDARRELHRSERECHQQDGEDDRDHGHDRLSDDAEDHLRDLRVLVRGEQRGRHPGCGDGRGLLQRGQHGAAQAEGDGDHQRPDQEAAA